MSRSYVKWSYSDSVDRMKLSAPELSALRAICWLMDDKEGRTPETTDIVLSRLTGYTSRNTFSETRKHLRALGLISYEHERSAGTANNPTHGRSNGYVYCVHRKTNRVSESEHNQTRRCHVLRCD